MSPRLCKSEELRRAFRLLINEEESERRVQEFLLRHDVDAEGYLLLDPAESLDTEEGSAPSGVATTGNFVTFDESGLSLADSVDDESNLGASPFGREHRDAESAPGWTMDLRQWSDDRIGRLLITDITFMLELLSVSSPTLAPRVQQLLALSDEEMEYRCTRMRKGIAALRRSV